MMYFEEALRVLLANKTRTFLTIIGLIIGVFAVITIEVLGHSMAGSINESLGVLSDNSFIVGIGSFQGDYQKVEIRMTDLETIVTDVPNVTGAVPLMGRQLLLRHAHNIGRFRVFGDSGDPFAKQALAYGVNLAPDDVSGALPVCVLSWSAYQRLFPEGGDPTEESIYAGPYRYRIVGVLAKPRQGALNMSFGGDVSIPYTTMIREYVPGNRFFAARFTVNDTDEISSTEVATIKKIRELRNAGPNVVYQTFDKGQFTQSVNGVFTVITFVVGLIGAVSLLVAGIGVMNIMLVSIAERTREIGTRKAIGARRGQILIQFFIESALLSSIGCFIGMALGLLAGGAINTFFISKLTGYTAPPPYGQAVLITTIFSAVVTFAFGTYPALRAAALDPIEALRYE